MKNRYIYLSITSIVNVTIASIFYIRHKRRIELRRQTLIKLEEARQFEDIIYFNFAEKEKEDLPPND